jgi:hypothetical protein
MRSSSSSLGIFRAPPLSVMLDCACFSRAEQLVSAVMVMKFGDDRNDMLVKDHKVGSVRP